LAGTRSTSLRRFTFVSAVVAAWIAGSTFGATPARRAEAMPLFQLEPAHAEFVPVLDGSEPIFILLLGSDARPGEEITGQRADSIHIVAINPAKAKVTIVGFPRDSYVPIPGFGSNKINSAMVNGGPELMVRTVEQLTGITMDYWALTWFDGFEQMIDDIGGLHMDVPFDVFDHYAHAQISAGPQVLNGRSALAFARARHALPTGDFGRSENQGRLIISALRQFQNEFTSDPSRLLAWVGAAVRSSRSSVPFDQLMSLAFTGTSLNARRVTNVVVPGGTGMVGGSSVVNLDQATLRAISTDLEDDGLIGRRNVPPSPTAQLTGPTGATGG
jgi:LCP family protein required for cell wall assembly